MFAVILIFAVWCIYESSNKLATYWIVHDKSLVYLFACCSMVHLRTLTMKGCNSKAFTRHQWPLSKGGNLSCHTCFNKGLGFQSDFIPVTALTLVTCYDKQWVLKNYSYSGPYETNCFGIEFNTFSDLPANKVRNISITWNYFFYHQWSSLLSLVNNAFYTIIPAYQIGSSKQCWPPSFATVTQLRQKHHDVI